MTMSDQPLSELADEIAELEAKASPSMWKSTARIFDAEYDHWYGTSPVTCGLEQAKLDADYIAAVRNANVGRRLAEAAAEIERLRSEKAATRSFLHGILAVLDTASVGSEASPTVKTLIDRAAERIHARLKWMGE